MQWLIVVACLVNSPLFYIATPHITQIPSIPQIPQIPAKNMDSPMSSFSASSDDGYFSSNYLDVPKLDLTNYHEWLFAITIVLRWKNLFKVVLGEEQAPPHEPGQAGERRLAKYHARVAKAACLLLNSCGQLAKLQVVDVEDPHEIWTILKRMDSTTKPSGRLAVYKRFQDTRYTEGGFTRFMTQLLDCRNMLASSEEPIPDSLFKLRLLDQLPREIYGFTFTIMSAEPPEEQTLDHLIDALTECYNTRKYEEQLAEASHITPTPSTNQLPGSQGARAAAPPYRGHRSRRPNRARCGYCERQGHCEEDCRTKRGADALGGKEPVGARRKRAHRR